MLTEANFKRTTSKVPPINSKTEKVDRNRKPISKESAKMLEKAKQIYMGILISDLLGDEE